MHFSRAFFACAALLTPPSRAAEGENRDMVMKEWRPQSTNDLQSFTLCSQNGIWGHDVHADDARGRHGARYFTTSRTSPPASEIWLASSILHQSNNDARHTRNCLHVHIFLCLFEGRPPRPLPAFLRFKNPDLRFPRYPCVSRAVTQVLEKANPSVLLT